MPKVGMEPLRRRQIISATMAVIHREGIARTTFARIAREAGVAPGLIQHYFLDKDRLLLATFRSIYAEFTAAVRRRLALAQSPSERVTALMEAQIAPSVLKPESVKTWMAIYGLMDEFPLLRRIEHAYDRRMLSTLTHALRAMGLARAEAGELAEELTIFIDGLWQNASNPVTFTPERARALLYRVLHRRLPGHSFVPPKDDTARRQAETSALSPEAQQFLRDNLPVSAMTVSPATVQAFRETARATARPEGRAAAREHRVSLASRELNGIKSLVIRPKSPAALQSASQPAAPPPRHFYLFGGGYISGEPEADLPISAGLAARLGAEIFSPFYRLAPEHPWPAAPRDALAAYRGFLDLVRGPFAVIGESAGGGLALSMLQAARAEGLALPDALVLLSPWSDLSGTIPCANDGHDPTATRRHLGDAARLYLSGAPDNASASPLRGRLNGLPPVFITTGSCDILQEQAHALSAALKTAGVPVTLRDWPGLWHVFEFYRGLPEAEASLDEIAFFLRHHCQPRDLPE